MGASPSQGAGQSVSSEDRTAANTATQPASDLGRQARDFAVTKLLGNTTGLRLAGDRLSELQPTTSMAEEAAAIKYSPEKVTKSPSSQYLAYGASPTRQTGA